MKPNRLKLPLWEIKCKSDDDAYIFHLAKPLTNKIIFRDRITLVIWSIPLDRYIIHADNQGYVMRGMFLPQWFLDELNPDIIKKVDESH
jgi:hypothetical protein